MRFSFVPNIYEIFHNLVFCKPFHVLEMLIAQVLVYQMAYFISCESKSSATSALNLVEVTTFNIFDFKHLILTSRRIVSGSQLGNGLGLCVHLCSFFYSMIKLSKPTSQVLSMAPLNCIRFYFFRLANRKEPNRLILIQMLQSVPYPVTPKAMQVRFPQLLPHREFAQCFSPISYESPNII